MKSLFTLLFTTLTLIVFGQTYSGTIIDTSKEPVAFANVMIYNKIDSSFIAGDISNEDGKFSLKSNHSNVYLEISFIGFKNKVIAPAKNDLGNIILEQEGQILNEVTITARRKMIEQRVDRLIFNLDKSIVNRGGTAIDALKNTPGVNADNDNLSIIGKGTVRVLINDRLLQLSQKELISYLSTIPSDDIKKIEVITTPPAKYDAEGNSGLINIVLKKARANSWNNQVILSYKQATYPTMKLGNTFNYNKDKLSMTVSLSGQKGQSASLLDLDIDYDTPWSTHTDFKNQNDNFSSRINLDYKLDDRSNIGIAYSNAFSLEDTDDKGQTKIADGLQTYLTNKGYSDIGDANHSANIHYTRNLDNSGRKMSIDVDFFDYVSSVDRSLSSERFVTSPSYYEAENVSDQHIRNYSGRMDFEHPTKWAKFSYGGKLTTTKTDSKVDFYNLSTGDRVFDPLQSNAFEYTENIAALYVDFAKSLGKKWQSKFGLRYENTSTKGISITNQETNKRNYNKLFPTVFLNYAANENNTINFTYNRRINRPRFEKLNPFRFYVNAYSYQQGNPFLKPQISDNVELSHIHKGKFITKAFFTFTNDGSIDVTQVDSETQIQRVSIDNFFQSFYYGLSETLILKPMPWWNSTSQVSVFRMYSRYKNGYDYDLELYRGATFNMFTKNAFTLNKAKTIAAEATFFYSGKQYYANFKTQPVYSLSLGINASFLQKKLNVNLSVNDLFRSSQPRLITETNGVRQDIYNYHDNQFARLTVSYNFGNQKIRSTSRKSGNAEEFNRAN